MQTWNKLLTNTNSHPWMVEPNKPCSFPCPLFFTAGVSLSSDQRSTCPKEPSIWPRSSTCLVAATKNLSWTWWDLWLPRFHTYLFFLEKVSYGLDISFEKVNFRTYLFTFEFVRLQWCQNNRQHVQSVNKLDNKTRTNCDICPVRLVLQDENRGR